MFKLLGMTKVDLTMGLYAMRKTQSEGQEARHSHLLVYIRAWSA